MIVDAKPYPSMKDSGVPWLGRVPRHWDVQRGKWLFRTKKEINFDRRNTNVLSLTLRGVVNNDPYDPEGLVPKDYGTYQLFSKGDLVFKLIDLENLRTSRVGLVHEDGIMSAAYVRLIQAHEGEQRYFFHQYFDLYQRGIFNQLGAGVRSTLGATELLEVPVVDPPREEQAAIVRFLDHVDRRVRRYIRAKQKLIKLLQEQRQAIIQCAVTRGLDPNVRLRPSGVERMGELPEHWIVQRLGRTSRVFNGTTPSRMQASYWQDGTVPWLASGKVNDWIVRTPSEMVTARAMRECSLSLVPSGAVIVGLVGQGKTRGKAALLGLDACINQNLAAIVPCHDIQGMYLLYFLTAFYKTLREFGRGGNQEALNCAIVANWRVPIPPEAEQRAICNQLDECLAESWSAERRVAREIELLREYRARLITEVVTGRLDVREAAARLPDEAEEPEPLDEAPAYGGGNEAVDDSADTVSEEAEA